MYVHMYILEENFLFSSSVFLHDLAQSMSFSSERISEKKITYTILPVENAFSTEKKSQFRDTQEFYGDIIIPWHTPELLNSLWLWVISPSIFPPRPYIPFINLSDTFVWNFFFITSWNTDFSFVTKDNLFTYLPVLFLWCKFYLNLYQL